MASKLTYVHETKHRLFEIFHNLFAIVFQVELETHFTQTNEEFTMQFEHYLGCSHRNTKEVQF